MSDARRYKRVIVLSGGVSAERDGSKRNGQECARDLRECGYDVVEMDVDHDIVKRLQAAKPDVVFNGAYGRGVEDGAIQGVLEWLRIPYTHSGVGVSALAMDKARTKDVLAAHGLPVPMGRSLTRESLGMGHPMKPPYILKPNAEGSSVGIRLVLSDDDDILSGDVEIPESLIVEAFIPGRDLTVAIVGGAAVGVTEIKSQSGLWDRAAKHGEIPCTLETPARVPSTVEERCRELAEASHRILGCRVVSRVDLRWEEEKGPDGVVILEVNTQPAMYDGSSFATQLASCGMARRDVCELLMANASLYG